MAEQQIVSRETAQNNAVLCDLSKSLVNRDEKGHLLPGSVLNPLGRPKSRAISERLRLRLEDGKADELADNLVEMAEDKGDKWLALAATKEITDRTEGKAMQRAMVGVTVDPSAIQRLNELAEKLGLG